MIHDWNKMAVVRSFDPFYQNYMFIHCDTYIMYLLSHILYFAVCNLQFDIVYKYVLGWLTLHLY